MYPHYFEKQQTDGVDYQIYVGAALKEDGAWDPIYLKNLRIVKTRIDKALINNTTERLTQPGKIAIVYSQPSEAQEYRLALVTFRAIEGRVRARQEST